MASASSDASEMLGEGAFVGVVGPSGAGKDSVIAGARERLRGNRSFVFPQRIVTRPPDTTERNIAIAPSEFDRMRRAGDLALSWSAHGLSYGVPAAIDHDLAEGRIVVVNISRSVVSSLRSRYVRGYVVLIEAPAEMRRERLSRRGREDTDAIDGRIARNINAFLPDYADLVIDNSGALRDAVNRLASFLASLAAPPVSK